MNQKKIQRKKKTISPKQGFICLAETFPNGTIKINLTEIYNYCEDEDKFIEVFAEMYQHELLHRTISNINKGKVKNYIGEEIVVYLLQGTKFNKVMRKAYEEYYGICD